MMKSGQQFGLSASICWPDIAKHLIRNQLGNTQVYESYISEQTSSSGFLHCASEDISQTSMLHVLLRVIATI